MGDQDHDSFFISIMLENIENQIPSSFDQGTSSNKLTPTTKCCFSSIIEKDKKCDQLAINHLRQELLREL